MDKKITALIAARGGGTPGELNRVFGKFGYTELSGGAIAVSSAWTAANIVRIPTIKLPNFPHTPIRKGFVQLESIQLHRIVAPVWVAAWMELERQGLTKYLYTFDGSFVPRHMLWRRDKPLSTHSWGPSIDLNVATNGYGRRPQMDMRVVKVFEQFGFTWGGRWRGPRGINDFSFCDGMHFQFTKPIRGTNPGFTPL